MPLLLNTLSLTLILINLSIYFVMLIKKLKHLKPVKYNY